MQSHHRRQHLGLDVSAERRKPRATSLRKAQRMGFGAIELPAREPGGLGCRPRGDLLDRARAGTRRGRRHGTGSSLLDRAGDVGHPGLPAARASLSATAGSDAGRRRTLLRAHRRRPGGWPPTSAPRPSPSCAATSAARGEAARRSRGRHPRVEPFNRYETSLINTVEQGLEALEPLLGPRLGLALDTYHLNIEEKRPDDAIRSAAGAASRTCRCAAATAAPVGDDHIDWPGTLDALDDAGYDGVLGPGELHRRERHDRGRRIRLATARRSQDDLAERSLRYLTALQAHR